MYYLLEIEPKKLPLSCGRTFNVFHFGNLIRISVSQNDTWVELFKVLFILKNEVFGSESGISFVSLSKTYFDVFRTICCYDTILVSLLCNLIVSSALEESSSLNNERVCLQKS